MIKVLYENKEQGCISLIDFDSPEQGEEEIVTAMYSLTASYLTSVIDKVDESIQEDTAKILANQIIDTLRARIKTGIEKNFDDYTELNEEEVFQKD